MSRPSLKAYNVLDLLNFQSMGLMDSMARPEGNGHCHLILVTFLHKVWGFNVDVPRVWLAAYLEQKYLNSL